MKATCWHGKRDMRVDDVPDPKILNDKDAIVRITSTAICGSDLHLLDGYIPTMQAGDILGHEFMGEVVEVGKDNKKLKVATASSFRSRLPAAAVSSAAGSSGRSATTPTRTPGWPRKSTATPRRDSSAIRT